MTTDPPTCPRCDRPLVGSTERTLRCRYCGWRDGGSHSHRAGSAARSRGTTGKFARGISSLFGTLVRLALLFAVLSLVAVPFGGTGIPAVDETASEVYGAVDDLGDTTEPESMGVTERNTTAASDEAAGANASESNSPSNSAIDRAETERYIHEYINEERTERDLEPLAFDSELQAVARYYSARMAREDFFAHTAPNGDTLSDRYDRFGYNCRVSVGDGRVATGGENLAYTFYEVPVRTDGDVEFYDTERELARGIVDGWMNSDGHRENLLRPYWDGEGIGVYATEESGRLRVYATQHFC